MATSRSICRSVRYFALRQIFLSSLWLSSRWNRVLGMLLVIILSVSLLPIGALAEEKPAADEPIAVEGLAEEIPTEEDLMAGNFSLKTRTSIRSFPMSQTAVDYLLKVKTEQDERKKRKGYNHKFDDFVCVRANGDLIPLTYVSRAFPQLYEKCGLRRLKFHELRHTNISLLLEQGASMKELQEWAGHGSFNTTADIYSHIQAKSKERMTAMLDAVLS